MKRLILIGLALTAQFSFASGFEKSILWGGETSGVAGIGASYIQGSQALYFNPAGLASDKSGAMDVSLNLSPTQAKFKAPFYAAGSQNTSNNKLLLPYALTYGQTVNDKLGWGVGIYVSGGTYADFTDEAIPGIKGTFESKADLTITELAGGVGYKVMDGLKVGLAYRIVQAAGNLSTPEQVASTTFAQADLKDLKDTNYMGFKLGAQYKLGDKTDLGFTYRSEVNFKAKGTIETTGHNTVGVGATSSTDVTVGTSLPAAWTLSARHQCTESWNFLGEYVFTQYSKVDNIAVQTSTSSTPLLLKWKDQHNIRLAGEYKGMMMPIRFGLIWTSQVTDPDHVYPMLTPPGNAYTVTLGTGYAMGSFRVDGGLEDTMVSGSGTGYNEKNQISEMGLHLGGQYMF